MVISMEKDLRRILAYNMRYFMSMKKAECGNANRLAEKAALAPNTVRNFLDPVRRTVTSNKPEGYPQLDKVEKIAKALGCQVYELFLPNIEKHLNERKLYEDLERVLPALKDARKLKVPQ